MKKTLSNKQLKAAKKPFPKVKRAEHQFTAQDYANLSKK